MSLVKSQQFKFALNGLGREPKVHNAKLIAASLFPQSRGQTAKYFARGVVDPQHWFSTHSSHCGEGLVAGRFIVHQLNANPKLRNVYWRKKNRLWTRDGVNIAWT